MKHAQNIYLFIVYCTGFSNAFLVNSKHELARTYNDNSVLENRHVSCLYTLVAEHEDANIFSLLDDDMWKEVRRIVIESILHTDMVHHFPMVSKVRTLFIFLLKFHNIILSFIF